MNSLKINEQKRYILLSEAVKLLSTKYLKGGKTKENRKIFPDIPGMANDCAAKYHVLNCK